MTPKSRMEKNKNIHKEINLDIAYSKTTQQESSYIYSTFEKLKKIDENYFRKKLQEFDKKHDIEKLYLDKDKSKMAIPEELKYEIRRLINKLDEIKIKEFIPEIIDVQENNTDDIVLTSDKYKSYLQHLDNLNDHFLKKINEISKKQSKRNAYSIDLPMNVVQQKRSQDTRNGYVIIDEISSKIDRAQNKLLKAYKVIRKNYKFKFTIWLLPTLLFIMLICIIIPIFI